MLHRRARLDKGLSGIIIFAVLLFSGLMALALDTGLQSPTLESGNFSTPTKAFADGAGGTSFATSNVHQFWGYTFALGANPIIDGIQVRVDASSSPNKTASLSVELSWNGGVNWTSTGKSTGSLPSTETTILLGGPSDTWGRTWTQSELSSTNFRVRVTANSSDTGTVGDLDWIPARVYYHPAPNVEINVAPVNNSGSITGAGIQSGALSLNRAWDVQVSAFTNFSVSVRLDSILVNGSPSSIPAAALSITANASGQPGTTNVSINPFTSLGLNVDISSAFSGLAGASNETSQVDATINLGQLGNRAQGNTLSFNLTFIVTEEP